LQVDATSPPGQDSVLSQSKMLPYASFDGEVPVVPTSFVLTQFHAVLLYTDRIVAVCTLNKEKVFQDVFMADVRYYCRQFT
jgi:vacuolar protein sorting-associated protein 18